MYSLVFYIYVSIILMDMVTIFSRNDRAHGMKIMVGFPHILVSADNCQAEEVLIPLNV